MKYILVELHTMLSALSVVSSREAARHPSSVDPPSHIPANAAMLLKKEKGEVNTEKVIPNLSRKCSLIIRSVSEILDNSAVSCRKKALLIVRLNPMSFFFNIQSCY